MARTAAPAAHRQPTEGFDGHDRSTPMSTSETGRWRLLGTPRLEGAAAGAAATAPAYRLLPETAPAYLGLYLAVHQGTRDSPVARESVAALLWPELPTERAQHNLRVALNRLQALLQGWQQSGMLHAERRRLRLAVASDLHEFTQAMAAGEWARAATLPAGPLLHGVQFQPYPALAEWLTVEREAQRRAWRRAIVAAAEAGEDKAVEDAATRYLEAYPSDLEVASLLASRLAATGRRQQAQDVIASLRDAAADELTPEELRAGLRQVAGTVAALAPPTLPTGALLGREADLAALQRAATSARWLTLVGLPGAGKTALLGAWLERVRAEGAPRVAHVTVHEGSTAASLTAQLLIGLGAPRAPGAAPVGAAAAFGPLEGRIVLDGLDLAELAPDVRALLQTLATACPRLSVLAASRRALGLPGEIVWRVAGLSLEAPPQGGPSAAASLFLREMRRWRPEAQDAGHLEAAERIARLCGGLPLALKLAAARTRWIEPKVLADEGSARQARPSASETAKGDAAWLAWLDALVGRLPGAQQQAWAALSLFPAAFEMRSASEVAAAPVAGIEALVEAGLVDVEPGEPPTLRLHALVRAFAAARLGASPAGRREAVARFLAHVETSLEVRRTAHGQPEIAPRQVERCLTEVQAAWPLALEVGALAALPVLVQALLAWHEAAGEHRSGERVLAAALPALDEEVAAEAAVLARVQAARATLLYRAGDHDAAEATAVTALRLAESTGQRRIARMSINVSGLSRWMMLRLDEAQQAFAAGLASAIEDGEVRGETLFTSNLALLAKSRGDYDAAEAAWRRVIELDRAHGDWWGATTCMNNLANLLRHRGRFQECEPLAQEMLRLAHEHRLLVQRPYALIGLALLRLAQGRHGEALDYLALIEACEPGSVEAAVRAGVLQARASIALAQGDGDAALGHIAAAITSTVADDDAANRAEALALYGRWLAGPGDKPDAARRLWRALLRDPKSHGTLRDELRTLLQPQGTTAPATTEAEQGEPADLPDLTLVAEQALALARARAATTRGDDRS